VNECVYNTGDSEYASYNSANMCQKLKDVLFVLIKLDSDRRQFIIKKKDILTSIQLMFVKGSKLINRVSGAESITEEGWNSS
jgi:hypothetical protein